MAAKKTTAKGWTWDRVADRMAAPETTVRICLAGDLIAEKDSLESRLRRAEAEDKRLNRAPLAPQIAERIQKLEDKIADAEVEFRFRALGRRAFSDLLAAHQPTEEQRAEAKDEGMVYQFNPETFPPVLVAASCVAPDGVTEEHARAAFDEWSLGQWTKLWRACLAANQGSADAGPKSVTASRVLASARSSITVHPGESPGQSSSGE